MELRQLRYFLALAKALNFTRAAQEMNIAQPPFGRQINQLESELETVLVDRDARPLKLTPAGETFRDHAIEVLAQINRMQEDTRARGRTGRATLRLGLEASTLFGRFPQVIRQLRAQLPLVEIDVVELAPHDLGASLKSGRVDIAIGRTKLLDPDIEEVVLRVEPLLVALPSNHRLAADTPAPLRLHELASETMILRRVSSTSKGQHGFNSFFAKHQFSPKAVIETGELQVALGLVAADSGISIVPESARRMRGDDVFYRPLDETDASAPLVMSHARKSKSGVIQDVKALLQDMSA